MFFDKFFKKDKRKTRPLIICVHGFGRRRADEFIPLVDALGEDYDIVIPELYDQRYIEDNVWHNWVSRAEEEIIKASKENREIILIGFSMGGVIATYLASRFNVKKLILLAPAYEYIVQQAKTKVASIVKPQVEPISKYLDLPTEFYPTFMDVVENCRDSVANVSCPVLMMAAINDRVISYKTSLKYYEKIPHENKKCVIFAEGQHDLLGDNKLSKLTINNIRAFIEDRI